MIASLFNPCGFGTKSKNFQRFCEELEKASINFVIVECLFGNSPPLTSPSANVIHVADASVLWQKERLLNIALGYLPKEAEKVAWVDADILFSNPHWATETSALLDAYPVVQPFSRAIRLPEGVIAFTGSGEIWDSFAYVRSTKSGDTERATWNDHGHTGFAWAARRSILDKFGLYDACVSGSADHYMAHAFAGDIDSVCYQRMGDRLRRHFMSWAIPVTNAIQGRIGYVAGDALHLWHGSTENRQYAARHRELVEADFDPIHDLRQGRDGAWKWARNRRMLESWAQDYFGRRLEDGEPARDSGRALVDLPAN